MENSMRAVVESAGDAVVSATADGWSLQLRVQAVSAQTEDAYRRRTRAVTTVQRVLAALPGATLSGERVESAPQMNSEQIAAGWSGTVSGAVVELGALRELISRLAGVEDVELNGPYWKLSPRAERMARGKALEAASVAARSEAEIIAQALGGQCGALVRAINQSAGMPIRMEHVAMMGEGAARGVEPLPARTLELDLEPDSVEVNAQVLVTFGFVSH